MSKAAVFVVMELVLVPARAATRVFPIVLEAAAKRPQDNSKIDIRMRTTSD
jgi:hypothetical protein